MRMAQYCRYCAWAYNVDEGLLHCEKRNFEMTAKQAKHSNACGKFALNEIDALRENEKGYRPTGIRIAPFGGLGEQVEMEGLERKRGRRSLKEGTRR